tara:strand:- start:157 stop:411 length:255 start_codon:yes stop_codon:yes gene_type:complete
MLTDDVTIFVLGGISFLFVFLMFKLSAIEVFKKELGSEVNQKSVWTKLFQVFLVDWFVCLLGVFGTGLLFVIFFDWLIPTNWLY